MLNRQELRCGKPDTFCLGQVYKVAFCNVTAEYRMFHYPTAQLSCDNVGNHMLDSTVHLAVT